MFNQLIKSNIFQKNVLKFSSNQMKKTKSVFNCIENHWKRSLSIKQNNTYFITTPIFYVNSVPHIGHLYSALIADTFHRFQQMLGSTHTIFSTGTDEHGIKIQRAAQINGIEPKIFCDQISKQFRNLFEETDISFTHFIRTTDVSHIKSVQYFWNTLLNNGFIYKSSYEGWYCPSDETFVTESQITTNEDKIQVSTESGNPVEWSSEDNYIFALSRFQDSLQDWISCEQRVTPTVFADILRHDIQNGLRDISVSRPKSRVSWGIEVPNDSSQIIYVWFDALINYLTVSGYPEQHNHLWPPDCQVIGKDILKFHGIYWPAFLMAAGLEPPRHLLCHSHWLKDDIKMSKSKGNVVNPFDCINSYTSDGFRYFLLRQGSLHTDTNFNESKAKQYLNSELADNLGNLLLRSTSKSVNKNQNFPKFCLNDLKPIESESSKLINSIINLAENCKNHYLSGNFYLGINEIMNCLRLNNLFINETKPWLLAKHNNDFESNQRLDSIIFITLETLRVSAILLQPIIPNISNNILNKLNINIRERQWIDAKHTFNYRKAFDSNPLNQQNSVLFAKIK